MSTELKPLLKKLFPTGYQIKIKDKVIVGEGLSSSGKIKILGTLDAAAIDHNIALKLSAEIIHWIETHPKRPIFFLVDTSGQILSRAEELLCLSGSFAHLAQTVELARQSKHPTLSLVTANAVSGGFLSFGLMADHAFALSGAGVRVMDLKAMARVTKIPHETLLDLSKHSPTFAPGAENYVKMGALEELWQNPSCEPFEAEINLLQQLLEQHSGDERMQRGFERGGRTLAKTLIEKILQDARQS